MNFLPVDVSSPRYSFDKSLLFFRYRSAIDYGSSPYRFELHGRDSLYSGDFHVSFNIVSFLSASITLGRASSHFSSLIAKLFSAARRTLGSPPLLHRRRHSPASLSSGLPTSLYLFRFSPLSMFVLPSLVFNDYKRR